MNKCCLDLVKFLVFVLNFAAWLASGALFAGALFLLFRSRQILGFSIDFDLSPDNPSALVLSLILILIVVFGFVFIFTFLGCCGAACQNRCMLGSFIIILFVFLGANIGGVAYMYANFSSETDMMSAELKKTIPYYDLLDDKSMVRLFWDRAQPALECCGANSYRDWEVAKGLKPGRKVPGSCCYPGKESDCVYEPEQSNAFLQGCIPKYSTVLQIAFWSLPALMAVSLLFALCVCSASSNKRGHDSHTPSRGRGKRSNQEMSGYSEETGYVYRNGANGGGGHAYASAPPYNPDYGHAPHTVEGYPTGVIPPAAGELSQPLIQPPPYHDVVAKRGHSYAR